VRIKPQRDRHCILGPVRSLDPRKWLPDLVCVALIVFICVGVLAACLAVAVINQAYLLTRILNPFSREAVIQ
jgi:hypothetical protein